MVYKWCVVPQCGNTSIKNPNKLFVFVPLKKVIRNKWLKLARRDMTGILPGAQLYFCEDHFDLQNDMLNYMEYHLMGSVSQIRMKPGCMPVRYECQPDRRKRTSDATKRSYILKKQRKSLIEECEKDLEARTVREISIGCSDNKLKTSDGKPPRKTSDYLEKLIPLKSKIDKSNATPKRNNKDLVEVLYHHEDSKIVNSNATVEGLSNLDRHFVFIKTPHKEDFEKNNVTSPINDHKDNSELFDIQIKLEEVDLPSESELILDSSLLNNMIKQEDKEETSTMPQPIIYVPIKEEKTSQSIPLEDELRQMEFMALPNVTRSQDSNEEISMTLPVVQAPRMPNILRRSKWARRRKAL